MSDIQKAKELLALGQNTCVLCKGVLCDDGECGNGGVYISKESGIKPMMGYIARGVDLKGFSVADKVVGKAAALLFALAGIKEVYAMVLSATGLSVLNKHGIKSSFDMLVDVIVNRSGTGICPMEQAVECIDDLYEAYEVLKQKTALMQKGGNMKKKLGFGAMRLPILEGDQTKIDLNEFQRMADYYMSQGFNYFDTAYKYHDGFSEAAVREVVVKKYPRDSYMLTDKMPLFKIKTADDYDVIFNEQLSRCGVEYFDIYLLHAVTQTVYKKIEDTNGFGFMKKLKESGRIKHIGLSFHDRADLLDKILTAHPETEYVQLQINYVDWDNEAIQSRLCYEVALKHNKPVIVMEPIKGGALAKVLPQAEKLFKDYNADLSPASWAVRYAASLKNVVMVLSGMSNLEQVKDNVSYMKDFKPLNDKENDIVNKAAEIIIGATAIPCTACRYCIEECPKNIPISDYFSLYNNKDRFNTWIPEVYYGQLAQKHGKASDCISCKKCEQRCPQHIEISQWMKKVCNSLEKK